MCRGLYHRTEERILKPYLTNCCDLPGQISLFDSVESGGGHAGYGAVAYRLVDAQYWGVPQRRRRISVVADFGGDTASEIQFDGESVSGDIAESGEAGEGLAEAAERGFNPAVARSLTARADGSHCADRGPNIVCSPHQGGL